MKRIVTLGDENSYSSIVTKKIIDSIKSEEFKLEYVQTKEEIVPSIQRKEVYGVVFPIQNKIIGDIAIHYLDDVILEILNSQTQLQIRGSYNQKINFALTGNPFSKEIYAHPAAAKQCSKYIQKHGLKVITAPSNPKAIQLAHQTNSQGIGDLDIIKKLGYSVEKENIQNQKDNQTRFLFFGREIQSPILSSSHYIYFIELENKPKQLYSLISLISNSNTNIEELIVRRRDCSNPKIKTGNAVIVTDSAIDTELNKNQYKYKKVGQLNLNWD